MKQENMRETTDLEKMVLQGRPLSSVTIIDAHCHFGRWMGTYTSPDVDAASLVSYMDRFGVDKCCFSSVLAIGPDFALGNEEVAGAVRQFPDRIYGLITFNPHYPKEMKQQLRQYAQAGFVGIKLHPVLHNYPADGENYELAWQFARDNDLFILTHSWLGADPPTGTDPLGARPSGRSSPELFLKFLDEYPGVPLILAHAGGTYAGARQAARMASEYKNVYIDCAGFRHSLTWMRELVDLAGEMNIIYGSDFPLYDFGTCLGRVCLSSISEGAKESILGLNLPRIAKLP